MFRFIAYGILLALLVYNAYFHFNGNNLLSELFKTNKEVCLLLFYNNLSLNLTNSATLFFKHTVVVFFATRSHCS